MDSNSLTIFNCIAVKSIYSPPNSDGNPNNLNIKSTNGSINFQALGKVCDISPSLSNKSTK